MWKCVRRKGRQTPGSRLPRLLRVQARVSAKLDQLNPEGNRLTLRCQCDEMVYVPIEYSISVVQGLFWRYDLISVDHGEGFNFQRSLGKQRVAGGGWRLLQYGATY